MGKMVKLQISTKYKANMSFGKYTLGEKFFYRRVYDKMYHE